jgi:DNA-binding response OmpR family regulator
MTKSKPTLAMIDDDKTFMQVMALSLSDAFSINTFSEPDQALHHLDLNPVDGVLLDLHMDEIDGFTVCEMLKCKDKDLPVFFLTNDQETTNIERGFELGSIDYFPKSMAPQELISRVKSRLSTISRKPSSEIRCRDILIDTLSRRVWIKDTEAVFSPKEFDILEHFMKNQDIVFSKQDILSSLWKDVNVNANNIDTHMFHIRKKFEGICTGIECRKGAGYILRSDTID